MIHPYLVLHTPRFHELGGGSSGDVDSSEAREARAERQANITRRGKTVNRPLHNLQRDNLAARAQLHLRHEHDPLLPGHLRQARRPYVRYLEREFLQRC